MIKKLTKEEILKNNPNIDAEALQISLDIEEQRQKAYKAGFEDGLKAAQKSGIKKAV